MRPAGSGCLALVQLAHVLQARLAQSALTDLPGDKGNRAPKRLTVAASGERWLAAKAHTESKQCRQLISGWHRVAVDDDMRVRLGLLNRPGVSGASRLAGPIQFVEV